MVREQVKRPYRHKDSSLWTALYKQRYLLLMSIPFLIWIFVFHFGPMYGWLMAFQNYNPNEGVLHSEWVGLRHFISFFQNAEAIRAVRNTIAISSLNIVAGNFVPLILALMLNEVHKTVFKRTIQTISYLPHFVSYVVIANLFLAILGLQGPVNELLMGLGLVKLPVKFWWNDRAFWYMIAGINTWKEAGWGSIIYMAALASINPELYEAATMDGAGRWRQMWNVTLPSIRPMIVIMLILSIGNIMNANFEQIFVLYHPLVYEKIDIIDTFVYRMGIVNGRLSYSTAVGLFKSVVSMVLVLGADRLSKKLGENGLL